MQSEFYHVELDRIRYSLVWEDSQTLYKALDISESDHLLVITSAGCNVLNSLLKNPLSVTAIDLNPVQNSLLSFKQHIILHHNHTMLCNILGLNGKKGVATAWPQLAHSLPPVQERYWSSFFSSHPDGILTSGKLEEYITGFYHTLEPLLQQKLQQLIQFNNVQEQYEYFKKNLHISSFRKLFIEYFDDKNLSKGRDTKLFRYAEESGGESFYNRLLQQVSTILVRDNYYFRFFFFGAQNLPASILPPCYQLQHFDTLKQQMHKLKVVTAEAVDYLLTTGGASITKASLSNIFEYTSHKEFQNACCSLFVNKNRNLKIVFWNLLHEQGVITEKDEKRSFSISDCTPEKDSCFYFKNVRLIEGCITSSPTPKKVYTL